MPNSFWLENGMVRNEAERPHVLVDCGYADHDATFTAVEALIGVFGKTHRRRRNAECVGSNRVVFRVPTEKVARLSELPAVVAGGGYCWTTHKFGHGPQFELASQRLSPPGAERLDGKVSEQEKD